jgi:hypothetical protein
MSTERELHKYTAEFTLTVEVDAEDATGRFRAVEFHEDFWSQEAIVVDTETNVLYLWVLSGYGGGFTPLLDSDGNVQLLNDESGT